MGLCSRIVTRPACSVRAAEASVITWARSTRAPSSATRTPSTKTSPRSMYSSASRREHMPRSDISFETRTLRSSLVPVGSWGSVIRESTAVRGALAPPQRLWGRASGAFRQCDRPRPAGEGRSFGGKGTVYAAGPRIPPRGRPGTPRSRQAPWDPTRSRRASSGGQRQHLAQVPQQLLFLVRLAEVEVDAELPRAVAVLLRRARRDHDDRDVRVLADRP